MSPPDRGGRSGRAERPPRTSLLVITDGRWDYLEATLASAVNLKGEFAQIVIANDSGERFPADLLPFVQNIDSEAWLTIVNGPRRGMAGNIQAGWDALRDCDYVFHLEDDFTFPAQVDVAEMVGHLERDSLAQVALLRQPWSPEEQAAGSLYGPNLADYTEQDGLVVHERLFTFNPCVYPRWVTEGPAGLEADVTARLSGYRFAYLGGLNDEPRCTHIGIRRSAGYRW